MKTSNIYEEDNKLILLPSNYKILYWFLIIILILFSPIFLYVVILIINQITETIKDFNLSHLKDISEIEWAILLFYLFSMLGFNSIRTARRFIPQKIVINKNAIQFMYKNSKVINLSMDLWQHIYIYEYKYRQTKYNYLVLLNSINNITFELFESKKEILFQIMDFFKKNAKLNILENLNINPAPLLKQKHISYESSEVLIKNKNRNYMLNNFITIIIYFTFLMIFFFQIESQKILQWDWFYLLNILITSIIFIIFFIIIFSSNFTQFFDIKIKKDKDKLYIYYEFFISSIPIKIKRKEFILDQNLNLNLNLYYDRKISFIEIFDLNEHNPPSLWKKLFKIKYFKIQLFGYYMDEVLEIYNQIIKILKA